MKISLSTSLLLVAIAATTNTNTEVNADTNASLRGTPEDHLLAETDLERQLGMKKQRNIPTNNHKHKHNHHKFYTGPQPSNYGTRIVGGNNAMPGEYPWFVSWGGCGASLIHDDIVLSAAHCEVSWASDFVVVGAVQDGVQGNGAVQRRVIQKVLHPSYNTLNDGTEQYDVMILKLDRPVQNKPVGLNKNNKLPQTNKDLTVIGFGATSEGGAGASMLQEVVVQTTSPSQCVSKNSIFTIDNSIHLCAAVEGGGKDSCQGDSGGPIFEYRNGVPVQVGIVSFGEGCARPDFPGVYARVSGFLGWIEQQVCELTSHNRPASCSGGGGGGGDDGDSDEAVPSTPVPTPAAVKTPAPVNSGGGDNNAPVSAPTPTFGGGNDGGGNGSFPTPTSGGSGNSGGTGNGSFPTPTSGGSGNSDGGAPTPTWW